MDDEPRDRHERLKSLAAVAASVTTKPGMPVAIEPPGGGRIIVEGSVLLAGQPFVLGALSLFATAYIIRTLGPSDYGLWATAASLTGATTMLVSLGLPPLFVRALSERPTDRRELLAEQLAVRMGLGCAAAVLSVLTSVALRYPPVVVTCAVVFGVALVLQSIWMVFGDYLQAQERFRTIAGVSFAAGVQLIVLAILAVRFGGGPVALSFAYLMGPLFTVVAFGWILHASGEIVAPRTTWARALQLVTQSGSIAAAQLMAGVRDRSEQLILPKVVGHARFGMFAGSLMPADRLNGLADAIGTAMYPRMSRTSGDTRHEYVARLILAAGLASATAGALLYLAAPAIAHILFPSAGDAPATLIRTTSVGLPAGGLALAFTYALQATGHHRPAARMSIWTSVISLVIAGVFVWAWGTQGAAAAWTTRQFLWAGSLSPFFWKHLNTTRLPAAGLALAVAALAAAAWLLSANDSGLPSLAWRASLLLAVATGCISSVWLRAGFSFSARRRD